MAKWQSFISTDYDEQLVHYRGYSQQARRSKNESGGAEPYIPYIPLMIEKNHYLAKKWRG